MRVKITEFHPEDAYYATTDGYQMMKEVIIVHHQSPASLPEESDWIYIHGVVEATGDTCCFYACKYEVLGDK